MSTQPQLRQRQPQKRLNVRSCRMYLSEALHQRLIALAKRQKRSVPAQLEWIVEQYLAAEAANEQQQAGRVA